MDNLCLLNIASRKARMNILAYLISLNACIGFIVLIMRAREWHLKRWLLSNEYTLLSKEHDPIGTPWPFGVLCNSGAITYRIEILDRDGEKKSGCVYVNGVFGVSESHFE